MIGFCTWREGLVLRPELAEGISDVGDVARMNGALQMGRWQVR